VNIKILACQIIGPAAAGSAGPVPTPLERIIKVWLFTTACMWRQLSCTQSDRLSVIRLARHAYSVLVSYCTLCGAYIQLCRCAWVSSVYDRLL